MRGRLPAIVTTLLALGVGIGDGSGDAEELTFSIRDETAPAGSMVQMKVRETEPTPISGGRPARVHRWDCLGAARRRRDVRPHRRGGRRRRARRQLRDAHLRDDDAVHGRRISDPDREPASARGRCPPAAARRSRSSRRSGPSAAGRIASKRSHGHGDRRRDPCHHRRRSRRRDVSGRNGGLGPRRRIQQPTRGCASTATAWTTPGS